MNKVSSILHGARMTFDDETIAERFFDAALQYGEHIAICNDKHQLTYWQLASRIRELMAQLSAHGVLSGQRLGILVEDDHENIELIIAAMALGIVFVPVSLQLPADRACQVIVRAHCHALIYDEHSPLSAALLAEDIGQTDIQQLDSHIIRIEKSTLYSSVNHADAKLWDQFSRKSLKPTIFPEPEAIAYCLFTSGSTGEPKCIEITQSGILNTILATNHAHHIQPHDRTILLTDIGFDAVLIDIFCPLIVGGSILTMPPSTCKTPEEIWHLTQQHNVTILQATPLVLAQVIDCGIAGKHQHNLRLIISGGDVLTPAIYEQINALGDITIANHYGPTEVSIDATYQVVSSAEAITIGRPIVNATCCIVNEGLEIVASGVVGELLVASPGLAKGYTGDPESTEKAFISGHLISNWPDAHTDRPERLYRTGDLACIQSGNISIFGRNDRQIKIRGVRGDLNEIEYTFRRFPGILDCRVLVESKPLIGEVLIAYITASTGSTLDAASIKQALDAQLPRQMVPNTIKVITEFPVNKNGKIDESQLPVIQSSALQFQPTVQENYDNDTEVVIAEACAELLQIPSPSRTIPFQELGAHSLLLTRLANLLSTRLNVRLSTYELLTHNSIARLAVHCNTQNMQSVVPKYSPATNAIHERFPLSDGQMMLWLTQQMAPNSALYNVPLVIEFSGHLQPDMFEAALQNVWKKHPMLGVIFSEENSGTNTPGIWQQYSHQAQPDVKQIDLTAKPRECTEAYINGFIAQPFELIHKKLVRTALLQLPGRQFTFVMVAHHLICDGWSIDVLYHDILDEYRAATSGNRHNSGSQTQICTYRDFVELQATQVVAEKNKLPFWTKQLTALQALPLPTDYPRPPIKSTEGNVLRFCFSELQSQELKQIAKHHEASLFQVLFSLFTILLRQYTQTNEIIVGVPSSGRNSSDFEKTVGMFVNTLIVKNECYLHQTFFDVLTSTKSALLKAMENEVQFSTLLQAVNSTRDASRTPIFQVMFDYHYEDIHDEHFVDHGLWAKSSPKQTKSAKFDLAMDVYESREIVVMLEYSSSLFSEASMVRFMEHFRLIKEKCLSEPVKPICAIPLFHEYLQLNENATCSLCSEEPNVISQFYAVVDKYKDNIAVEDGHAQLTYQQLDEQSNVLAHRLIQLGIGYEDLVGVYLPRSIEYVVAVVAILKAGAAFMPLDPAQPIERLEAIARTSGAMAMISSLSQQSPASDSSLETFGFQTAQILFYEQHILGTEGVQRPARVAYPEQLSFVFYTSGSTGTPKGVMVPLRGLHNQLKLKVEEFRLQPDDGIGFIATPGFDVSIWQSLTALITGARTVIYPDQIAWEPEALIRHTNCHRVVVIETVPSHFNSILQYLEQTPKSFQTLRYVMLNGEPLLAEHCDRWFDLYPDIPIVNGYGATEVSDDCTHNYVYSHSKINRNKPMPVNGTLPGYHVYVLDEMLNVVPPGAAGEICVGGLGVARGYVNDRVKTASQFVPDPYAGGVGAILYRTGDMASYDTQGNIYYLGRTDSQLKINGARVELGEIESAVRALQNVEQSLTHLNTLALPRKELITFYIEPSRPNGSRGPLMSPEKMQAELAKKLPVSVIPRHMIRMTSFPVKPNGKIDTKALFNSTELLQALQEHQKVVLPSNQEERGVLEVWNEVLGVYHKNILVDFFDAGGHSMSATVLLGRIHHKFGCKLSIKDFYLQPNVKHLSDAIRFMNNKNRETLTYESEDQISGFNEIEI